MSTQQKINEIVALTVQDPYGTLIITEKKRYETRDWTTRYRGDVVIHVGKTLAINWDDKPFLSLLRDAGISDPYKLPVGCAVGVATLTAIYRTEAVAPHISEWERAFGLWKPGRAAWEFTNVQRFKKPIPCRGQQYLWTPPDEVLREVQRVRGAA